METSSSVTTSLLTLLNISATKAGKRRRDDIDDFLPSEKLNKRKSAKFADDADAETSEKDDITGLPTEHEIENTAALEDDPNQDEGFDRYEQHFGPNPSVLTAVSRSAIEKNAWNISREKAGKIGLVVISTPEGSSSKATKEIDILERLKAPYQSRLAKESQNQIDLQKDLLSTLSTRRDLYLVSTHLESRKHNRESIALHALNHITKKRRRILKNNERLAHAAKEKPNDPVPEDAQDQGFTRPSVLFLLPFRSSALDWFHAITSHTPPPAFQIENQARFVSEYGLPLGTVDKLTNADPGTYPPDHVETFKGNVDDNFRVGMKMTRKSVKMFAEFYGCDIILASPLGLRRSIEKEKHADYLSSIEVLVIDQIDSLTMQNWEHVKFVMSHLNKLPKESHDTDFSRIKPWYLDEHGCYLRQSILLSAYETPETRSLFNSYLKNVAGKIRTEKKWSPIQVPDGINQNFVHFDCPNPKDEPQRRFLFFTSQLLPAVLKSAVQSTNTIVFIPSSFDFIRVHNYFRKHAGVSFAVLSEYSSNQDISRARQSFFKGSSSFLLVSERFHFYKRYKIRGIRNVIFYGPPDHPQYFTEFLSYPFLDDGVETSDLTCRVLYSKYDWFRLERIAGTQAASELIAV